MKADIGSTSPCSASAEIMWIMRLKLSFTLQMFVSDSKSAVLMLGLQITFSEYIKLWSLIFALSKILAIDYQLKSLCPWLPNLPVVTPLEHYYLQGHYSASILFFILLLKCLKFNSHSAFSNLNVQILNLWIRSDHSSMYLICMYSFTHSFIPYNNPVRWVLLL